VSQTSSTNSASRLIVGPDLPRRLRRLYGFGAGLWLLQCSALALHPGLRGIEPAQALGALLAAALACTLLGFCKEGEGQIRPGTGALAGGAAVLVHFMTLTALPGIGFRPDGAWGATAVAVAAVTGAALAWSGALAEDRWGRLCVVAAGAAGLALMHVTALRALPGPDAVPLGWIGAAGMLWCGSLGLLLGIRLGDLSLVVSRRSIALRGRFRVIAEALPIPIVMSRARDHRLLFTNRRTREQFGLEPDLIRGLPTDSFYARLEDRQSLLDRLGRGDAVENCEVELRRIDGSTFWALLSARSITVGGETAILASFHDISDRKSTEAALLDSEIRYALISRAANDGIWDWDIPSGVVYFSSRWKEIVGIAQERGLHSLDDWLNRVHPDDIERLRGEIAEHLGGNSVQLDSEYRMLHGDGRFCWMQCRAIAMRNSDGEPIRMAGSQSDITLRKTYEANLLNAAYEDRLTGIHNRAYFNRLVAGRDGAPAIDGTAILLLNVDRFRRLNDSLGNAAGDTLLIGVARRLSGRVGTADALARIGSDEFAIWLNAAGDRDRPQSLAETMLAELSQPYALGDVEMSVGVSIGVAAPALGDAENGADLLRNARLALDRAKSLGGARVEMFDNSLLRETNLTQRLSRDLAGAERLGQIFFEYQPVVSLEADGTNPIIGFEALMRWRHPELGLIPAGRFIPIAEEAGLIGRLGLLAIECAAGELDRWTAAGLVPDRFSIAVNLSNRQISDRSGVLRLHAVLDRLAMAPGRLQLEITETVLMSDPAAMATTLHELRQRGVALSLDDFGTGYSSLSYLHRFPLDVLKIDRSFVSRMVEAPDALRLVRSIIDLSHDLGLKVVAEGVEAVEQRDLLRQFGCDHAQGFYFSHPVSSDQARLLLERHVL
jgi:diguanylate cyclase (GGDEF)-like protein/PAS domain S-box-containing protein